VSQDDNPLLQTGELPRFDEIDPAHVEPAMRRVLADQDAALQALEKALASGTAPSWERLVEPLERIGDALTSVWGVVGHLMGVKNSDALRVAFEAVQTDVVAFGLRLAQSGAIHQGLRRLRDSDAWAGLDPSQQRIIASLLRDALRAGVGLEGAERERFSEVAQELAELSTRFSNHVLDSTREFALQLSDPGDVAGLPESWRAGAAQAAR